jgi:hypothetical protein
MNKLSRVVTFSILGALCASATSITYITPTGSSLNMLPVDASASFVLTDGMLTVTLNNLQANPKSVVQNLSNLEFQLDGISGETLNSSTGTEITINADGTTTLGSVVSTGWELTTLMDGMLQLSVLNTPTAPTHTVVGPPGANGYTNINGSFLGPHDPFLNQSATFVISDSGITPNTSVSNVVFSFNTAAGYTVAGVPQVPEPATFVLAGVSLVVLRFIRRPSKERI